MIDEYEKHTILDFADRILGQSLEDGNFDLASEAIEKFRAMNKASILGVCKILHGVKLHWEDVAHEEGDSFEKWAVRSTGYSVWTIDKRISNWKFLNDGHIPEEFKEKIWSHTIRQLDKEASLVVNQGYELDHDDWRDLSEAIDEYRVADICAKIKGRPRNKNHMALKIDDKGDIFAFQDVRQRYVGSLSVDNDDPLVIKAIHRICNDAGISKKSDY